MKASPIRETNQEHRCVIKTCGAEGGRGSFKVDFTCNILFSEHLLYDIALYTILCIIDHWILLNKHLRVFVCLPSPLESTADWLGHNERLFDEPERTPAVEQTQITVIIRAQLEYRNRKRHERSVCVCG